MRRPLSRLFLGAIPCLAGLPSLSAQCTNAWISTGGLPGVSSIALCSRMHDPDGAGPAPARLIVGGVFFAVGNTAANNVAAWDPATGAWSALGTGLSGGVQALASLPNGELVAASGATVSRWNGTSWLPMGAGFTDPNTFPAVNTLAVDTNGDLIAGGQFTSAGGTPANNVARWNGTSWSALGTGTNAVVSACAPLPTGGVVVGGSFTLAGGIAVNQVARWDGLAWSPMGSGMTGTVTALAAQANGDLLGASVTGGLFSQSSLLTRWNGATWSQVGLAITDGPITAITRLSNGDILAAGGQSTFGPAGYCRRWNGSAWSSLANTTGEVQSLTLLPTAEVVMAGRFTTVDALSASGVARWDGAIWNSMGTAGLQSRGWPAMTVAPNGDALVGGDQVLRWNGIAWSPLGGPFPQAGPISVRSMVALDNGDVVVGGLPNLSGTLSGPGTNVARWNGTSWVAMGNGLDNGPYALVQLPDGSVVAGGTFGFSGGVQVKGLARWDGTAWSELGGGVLITGQGGVTFPGFVYALAIAANGDLIVGGRFDRAGPVAASNVARWNGSSWSALGVGTTYQVAALAALPNGDIVGGGEFPIPFSAMVNRLARWNGVSWSYLGSGTSRVFRIQPLPNGDLLALNSLFTPERWNGTTWSAVGTGFDDAVQSFAFRPSGELLLGGEFLLANGLLSPGVVRIATTCPASATATGAGCTGVGGPNVLTASTLPWIGSTCTTLASGLPPASLAVVVTGWSSLSLPLAAVLQQGSPGCSLLVSPDLLAAVTTNAGQVPIALPLPNTLALAGLSLQQQVVALEFVAGNIAAATSTNALVLQCGTF